jgi:hypothetical protein
MVDTASLKVHVNVINTSDKRGLNKQGREMLFRRLKKYIQKRGRWKISSSAPKVGLSTSPTVDTSSPSSSSLEGPAIFAPFVPTYSNPTNYALFDRPDLHFPLV